MKEVKPKVVLVGNFPDLFLEGISELGVDFSLHKSSKPIKDTSPDIIVLGSDMSDQALDYVMKSKAVPVISAEAKGFEEFNPISESGNAFVYENDTPWFMLFALIRAMDAFRFTYDWQSLKNQVTDLILEREGFKVGSV